MLVSSYGTMQVLDSRLRFAVYFLNVSPVNAKLTSPSYVYQYIFLSSATYTISTVTPTTKFVSVLFFPLIVHPRINAVFAKINYICRILFMVIVN